MRPINLKVIVYLLTILAAFIIIVDFVFPGTEYTENIVKVQKSRQDYYNAAQNYHYSYKVITSRTQFAVYEDFASVDSGTEIKYFESFIFKKVNRYQLLPLGKSTIYSFRIVSGLVLPLIIICSILIMFIYKKNLNTLIFVLQIVLIGNYLILLQ